MIDESDIRFQISAARRILFREGCDSQTAGHVSVRDPDTDAFWVTTYEYLDETLPSSIIKVDFDLNLLEGDHESSPAIDFHAEIYRARPDVNSIVHHHAFYTAVISSTGGLIGRYNLLGYLFFEDQAIVDDGEDGTGAEAHRVVDALGEYSVLLLKNHGGIVVGESLKRATIKAVLLEKAAQYHYCAVQVRGTELTNKEQLVFYRDALHTNVLEQMWESHLRRLRRSDPDLFLLLEDDRSSVAGSSSSFGSRPQFPTI